MEWHFFTVAPFLLWGENAPPPLVIDRQFFSCLLTDRQTDRQTHTMQTEANSLIDSVQQKRNKLTVAPGYGKIAADDFFKNYYYRID